MKKKKQQLSKMKKNIIEVIWDFLIEVIVDGILRILLFIPRLIIRLFSNGL